MEAVDLVKFVTPLLGLCGVVLQFLVRQFKVADEMLYWTLTVVLCSMVYGLTTPLPLVRGWQLETIMYLLFLSGASVTVRGGSSLTDMFAKKAAEKNPDLKGSIFVPVTKSQGGS